jgi:hypothetical protein
MRSLYRLLGFGAAYAGSSFLGAGLGGIPAVGTAFASVLAGNVANTIDALIEPPASNLPNLQDNIDNQDLTKAVGKAIALVIALVAEEEQFKNEKNKLRTVAKNTEKNWLKIIEREFTKKNYRSISPEEVETIIIPVIQGKITNQEILTVEEWKDVFASLNLLAKSGGGFQFSKPVWEKVPERLQEIFPNALLEILKEDLRGEGKAYGEILLKLLIEIQEKLHKIQDKQGESPEALNILENIINELQENHKNIKIIDTKIESGWREISQKILGTEQSITDLLGNLKEDTTDIKEDISCIKKGITNIEYFVKYLISDSKLPMATLEERKISQKIGFEQSPELKDPPFLETSHFGTLAFFRGAENIGLLLVGVMLLLQNWNPTPFFGRQEDIKKLKEEIIERKRKVISLWGQQGMGKSYLCKKLTEETEILDNFKYIIWSQTDNYQPLQCFLSYQIFERLPALNNLSQSDYIYYLIELLSKDRILLIIDGLDQLKEDDKSIYKEYIRQLEVVSNSDHQSCLLVISQKTIKQFKGFNSFDYKLEGLDQSSLEKLIRYQGLDMSLESSKLDKLIETYNGNPGHLRMVCSYIEERFLGDVNKGIEQTTYNIIPYSELLEQQFKELSESEKVICYWLAVYGTQVSLDNLEKIVRKLLLMVSQDNFSKAFIDALQNLEYSLMIERKDGQFFLIPEHRRYFINKIIRQAKSEISDLLESSDLESHFKQLRFDTKNILKNYRLIADNYPSQDDKQAQEKRILGGLIKVLDAYSITQEELATIILDIQALQKNNSLFGYFSDNLELLMEAKTLWQQIKNS